MSNDTEKTQEPVPEYNDVPDLLDEAARKLEEQRRELELANAQLSAFNFIDKVLQAGAGLKPKLQSAELSIVSHLQHRAKTIRRVTEK